MQLSIIILNYNASVFLELCVASCHRAIKNLDAQIIVADNQSSDASMQRLATAFPQIKTISFDKNHGFSRGNNLAVEQSQGEYIVLINPDVILGEEVLEDGLAFAKAQTDLGFLGIQLVDGCGSYLPESKRKSPSIGRALKKIMGWENNYYDHSLQPHENGITEILVGAFMMGKRSVYQELGGLDERYFMYGEDIDLSYTALNNGFFNYYMGSQTALHFKGESTVRDKFYYQRFYGAMSLFYEKYYPATRVLTKLLQFSISLINPKRATLHKSLPLSKAVKDLYCISSDPNFDPEWSIATYQLASPELNNLLDSTWVFDTRSLSMDAVIQKIKSTQGKGCSYRFLTMERDAYCGSDSSEGRGEVVIF